MKYEHPLSISNKNGKQKIDLRDTRTPVQFSSCDAQWNDCLTVDF